jgi:putative oxidoreductase
VPTTGGAERQLPEPASGHSYAATRGKIGKSAAQIPDSAANALTLTRVTSHSHDPTWRRPDESSAPTAGRPAGASLVDPEDDLPSANYAGDYETTTIPYYNARPDNAPLAGSRYGVANTHEPLPYAQPSVDHHDSTFGSAHIDAEHEQAPVDGRRGTQDFGLLVLRVGLGVVLVAHGLQKLFGWWGGEGLTGFRNSLSDIGYQHADILTYCAAGGEIAAGVLLVLGLFTPLAAAGALAYLINGVVAGVAGQSGRSFPYFLPNGHEYELTLIVATVAVILVGPGRYGFDAGRGWARRPFIGSLAALLVGIAGGVAVWVLLNGANPVG